MYAKFLPGPLGVLAFGGKSNVQIKTSTGRSQPPRFHRCLAEGSPARCEEDDVQTTQASYLTLQLCAADLRNHEMSIRGQDGMYRNIPCGKGD
ncbi:hypothetical protein M8818_003693 [Zalaria obscura]|uniref:Uncharacterized protein n=1 Tax=Zalaria obscura TaxID=2024903 RepID=A0ACC3SEZ9_9PEZI